MTESLGIMAIKNKIVLVPFLFDDQKQQKVRPALCLTEPIEHVVIESREQSDVFVSSNFTDFKKTGLHLSSTIRLHRLLTIANENIRRQLGELPDSFQKEVEIKLKQLFFS